LRKIEKYAARFDYPGNSGHFPVSRRSLFEGLGTDAAKVAVAMRFIVEDFDLVEDIGRAIKGARLSRPTFSDT
jgi:hypothetical protein